MYIDWNSKLTSIEKVRISPTEHGFLYGIGFFETFCFRNNHIFLLSDHLDRIRESLQIAGIEVEIEDENILQRVRNVVHKNQFQEAVIRLNISAGEAEVGNLGIRYQHPTQLLFARPIPTSFPEGKALQLLHTKRNTSEGSIRFKSHHYLNNRLAKLEIESQDIEGIFLNHEGHVVEGIVSNVFFMRNGILYTPSVETGLLNGVTRRFIIELARKKGIIVTEGLFKPTEIQDADEVFLTNAVQGVIPVHAFEKPFPGNKGPIFQLLKEAYEAKRDVLYSVRDLL